MPYVIIKLIWIMIRDSPKMRPFMSLGYWNLCDYEDTVGVIILGFLATIAQLFIILIL